MNTSSSEAQRSFPLCRQAALATLLLLVCGLGGCGTLVRGASFRERPDATAPGSQLGPFDGRVVDADTGRPLEAAQVRISWAFSRGVGTHAPETARTVETITDADGRYHIPRLGELPRGLSLRLDRATLIIHHKGYVAYRSDVRFAERRPRLNFTQRDNAVALHRWGPELSHAQHLLFVGGAYADNTVLEPEMALASAQLSDALPATALAPEMPATHEPTLIPSARGDARRLLRADDLRAVSRYSGPLSEGPLADPGDATDTWHLRATDRPERYDVAIRVWRLAGEALTEKYTEIRAALPDHRETQLIGDRSFTTLQDEILALGFLARPVDTIVVLTCGRGQCASEGHLVLLAERIYQRTLALPSLSDLKRLGAEAQRDLEEK